jgi:hypothetical protein
VIANWWLIKSFGVTGAAFGILLPYILLGVLRHRTLELAFGWERRWSHLLPPFVAALSAFLPAFAARFLLGGFAGEIVSAAIFLGIFGAGWRWYHRRHPAFSE